MHEKILEGALTVFKKKGPKFTMDDIAAEMKMSKKTIYTVFKDKNELICKMVDYAFDMIKKEEDKIFEDPSLSTVEKLRAILAVLPENHYGYDFGAMQSVAAKYPSAYEKLTNRLDSGWDKTFDLLKQGMKEEVICNINLEMFKLIYEASIEKLLLGEFIKNNNITYPAALNQMVDILVDGIIKK